MTPLLDVENLRVTFSAGRENALPWSPQRVVKAVNGVSFTLRPGETLGIVGESGCGKSTLARALIQMVEAEGSVTFDGTTDLLSLSPKRMQPYRSQIQMIFQDPLASLNPRMTVGEIIAEPLKTHQPHLLAAEVKARVRAMMERVSLLPNQINRYPHEFSGGQCQRIGIARALIVEPKLLICDEPVSALDVSIQAQVVNLLKDIQQEMGLSMIFIAHDLSVVQHISDRVMVLYLGKVMEIANRAALYSAPRHPYTKALISAVPIPDPAIERAKKHMLLEGDLPSPLNPPSGCVFRTRCPIAQDACAQSAPALASAENDADHFTACHFPG
ncbi:oligopeptide/dipeptide ABC transporter ATP-binding protein [Pseudovibrio sp. SPO723]|uniref:oligopeptide/dipeptide ABC transporter ATP-binding protein n=1 Tax=Nesiotobacter zosterae TaxID=392721 RepID=UPI0029C49887|nr:oligopeptide/dipeptide ABC transporter ATP-binding protein [Pseudovibrio sp. SPO723]MDX5594309.1 oligopeptide/dipeptide ABC transporter ATP-binding protein [Pseudovibrio sp. SPO723]